MTGANFSTSRNPPGSIDFGVRFYFVTLATLLQNCVIISQSAAKLLGPTFRAKIQNGGRRHIGCYFCLILWCSCIQDVKFSPPAKFRANTSYL